MSIDRLSPQLRDFVGRARVVAEEPAPPFSVEERFRHLLAQGLDALRADSYGIAASYVVRADGVELELFGHNTLAVGDPHGHAEMNAVRLAVRLRRLPARDRRRAIEELVADGRALVRAIDDEEPPTTELFSTLEPCPMCTVNVLNAGIDAVTYAHPDPLAGGLAGERLERLSPLWGETARAQGLRVRACQDDRPSDTDTYLPTTLSSALLELFEGSRRELDRQLIERGFFEPFAILEDARDLAPDRTVTKI